ncbi:pectin lyase fold/virulence factor [Lyophyllum atratum]|nr:pectin lyase fold/virulence factor [Lyophyllum atratum]
MIFQCRSAAFFLFAFATFVLAKVQVYQPPAIYKRSQGFSLRAGGRKVPVIAHADYDYAHFSADTGIDIELTVRGRVPIKGISIVASRFDRYNKPQLNKNKLTWRLQDHKHFILKIEGLREIIVAVDPLETAVPPNVGPNIFNVVSAKYKADKLGNRITTHAFHAAIADAGQSMRANPIIYVPAGAVLRFTGNPKDYTEDWTEDGEGRAGTNWISTAHNSTDIKIFGRGTIDGDAWTHKDTKFAPSIIVPVLTSHFTFDGPILRESGSTALNVVRSNGVDIRNLKVFNRVDDMVDNGSVDILESSNVTVSDAIAISMSDAFTTKASKPAHPGVPTWPGTPVNSSDILFQHCLAWTANYGFKVGQGAVTNQQNIKFFGSTVYEAAVAMGVHKKWGSGSATNVTFENMIVKSTPFTTSYLNGMVGSWLALFVEDGKAGVGPISDIHVKNVLVLGEGGSAPLIHGVAGAVVSDVELRNIWLPHATHPAASLHDFALGEMKFTTNISVVNAWDSLSAIANTTAEAKSDIVKSQPGAEKEVQGASQTTLE